MKAALRLLLTDVDLAAATADAAYRHIVEHHTCRHRAIELLGIADGIRTSRHAPAPRLCEEPIS
jgi:spore maturation protein CgeB